MDDETLPSVVVEGENFVFGSVFLHAGVATLELPERSNGIELADER